MYKVPTPLLSGEFRVAPASTALLLTLQRLGQIDGQPPLRNVLDLARRYGGSAAFTALTGPSPTRSKRRFSLKLPHLPSGVSILTKHGSVLGSSYC